MTRLRPTIRWGCVVLLLTGVVLQFIQYTDPTFPLLYFTVDSALLLAGALIASSLRPDSARIATIRGAATVAVLLSALIYATVIAPASSTGTWFQPWDDGYVRAAMVVQHAAAPVVALADFLLHPYPAGAKRGTVLRWCAWPVAYFIPVTVLDVAGIATMPYPFLAIDTLSDLPAVLGAMVALSLLVGALGYGLLTLHGVTARHLNTPARGPSGDPAATAAAHRATTTPASAPTNGRHAATPPPPSTP